MSGGLNIPEGMPIGIGSSNAQSIEQLWATSPHSEESLRACGITDYTQPKFPCPVLTPETFNVADAKTYTDTYLYLNAWFSYIAELLSKINMYILEYQNMLTHLEAQTRENYRQISKAGEKMSQQEIQDRIILNPQHQNLTRTLQQYLQYKERLQTKADAIGRSMRVLSRQVEIRRQDLEQGIVGGNIASRSMSSPARGRFGT